MLQLFSRAGNNHFCCLAIYYIYGYSLVLNNIAKYRKGVFYMNNYIVSLVGSYSNRCCILSNFFIFPGARIIYNSSEWVVESCSSELTTVHVD